MYFKLSSSQEKNLLGQPETGMGYQVVEANKPGSYTREKFLVLNSEVVLEINGSEGGYIRKVINEGIFSIKGTANLITLNAIKVLNEKQFRNQINESKNDDEIKFTFYIKPIMSDTLQRGKVQPANGKSGGGKEVYFARETAMGTFFKQTPY